MAQPHKGTRVAILTRVPQDLSEAIRKRAAELDQPIGTVAADLIAAGLQMPRPSETWPQPKSPSRKQTEELPLPKAS